MASAVVAFQAHPDDHRRHSGSVGDVLVTATAGEAGLTSTANAAAADLADRCAAGLRAAAALGVDDVRLHAYNDSAMDGQAGRDSRAFARADVDKAASRLAAMRASVSADVLISDDSAGGYGHPDHVPVHGDGLRAAELAATPLVLEAAIERPMSIRPLVGLHRMGLLRLTLKTLDDRG